MRISDWSSDVCSSDLPSRERQACQVLQNRRICMIFGRVKSLDAILATAERKSLNRSLGAFQLTMLGIGAVIGTGIFVLTAEAAQKAGPGRSEEHTSELQSLMRISYAVFCLKKKKKLYK